MWLSGPLYPNALDVLLSLFLGEAQCREHLGLNVLAMNTNGAGAALRRDRGRRRWRFESPTGEPPSKDLRRRSAEVGPEFELRFGHYLAGLGDDGQ